MILQKMVNDSTPCKAGTNNMCVAGVCRVSVSIFVVLHLFDRYFIVSVLQKFLNC